MDEKFMARLKEKTFEYTGFWMKMGSCFSITAAGDWLYRQLFAYAGLQQASTDLGDGTVMHCWVPKAHKLGKPTLLLVHGFGANAMWQYGEVLRHFVRRFNVYVPDLVFFGGSYTTRPERTEAFQAECLKRMMEEHRVKKMSLVGISYGGFVGYSMAAQFPEAVEKVVLCCAGVCAEERDLSEGLFTVDDLEEAAGILVPQTPEKLRQLLQLSFLKPAKRLPSFFLSDFIEVMCTSYVEEKKELIKAVLKDRKLSDIPRISQQTLIIWGDHDQIFPVELGRRLERHVGDSARLVIIKNAGHAVNLEKYSEFTALLKEFLLGSSSLLYCQIGRE